MKRRRFLQTTFVATPLATTTHFENHPAEEKKGFKVKAGEGRRHGLFN